MVSRRNFIKCSCGVLMAPDVGSADNANIGCSISAAVAEKHFTGYKYGARPDTSGITSVDNTLGEMLALASREMRTNPAFSYYDDFDYPNALASGWKPKPEFSGLVLFGLNFLTQTISKYGFQSVAAVIGHEFGHILQFTLDNRETYNHLASLHETGQLNELHADYLSGFYLHKLRQAYPEITLEKAGIFMQSIGDYSYTNPNHHGTPGQRLSAAERGVFDAQKNTSIYQAFQNGAK